MNITELMRALQFGDSALPVGAFSFSNGLESAIQQHVVHDVETLHQFVLTVTHQAASADGIALLQAHRATEARNLERIMLVDWALHNRKLNEEMRVMSVRMGRKLGELAGYIAETPLLGAWLAQIKDGCTPGVYPVGLGIVFASLGLSGRDAFAIHQYGVATMILGAALRLLKVTYLDTQSILFAVNVHAEDEYVRVANATLEEMASFAPVLDILAASHVKAHVRMFMN